MKIQTINELNAYFDPGVGHAKGRGRKILNRSEIIICTNDNIHDIVRQEVKRLGDNADLNHLDVSKVTDMYGLFHGSDLDFNGDVSQWNVSNVISMNAMFCGSKFNGDISNWDVSNVTDMNAMFSGSDFNGDISKWDVSNVMDMYAMFCKSKFNHDISNWKIDPGCEIRYIFDECPIKPEYKPQLPK